MSDKFGTLLGTYLRTPLFDLGFVVATPGAIEELSAGEILCAVTLHAGGDWGLIVQEDLEANNLAVKNGGRLFSLYESKSGRQFWVITESDRSATTVLLPEEY